MAERKQCEFQLIRYVPDPVKNEFINIGVLLRPSEGGQSGLRFTRDWGRVHCLDPDADTEMLEALESEIGHRLGAQPSDHPRPILGVLESSLSNGVQISESKGYLAESFLTGLEELMRLYVDPPRRERKQRRSGRTAVFATMRSRFEEAGVWELMKKQIPISSYTQQRFDTLKIDCGYKNGKVKMFHAVSLETETGVDDAKLLAFAAPALIAGVKMREAVELELMAITEPIGWHEGEGEPAEERKDRFDYVSNILKPHGVWHMTTSNLPNLADAARRDLKP